jgi:hypothetical protein
MIKSSRKIQDTTEAIQAPGDIGTPENEFLPNIINIKYLDFHREMRRDLAKGCWCITKK